MLQLVLIVLNAVKINAVIFFLIVILPMVLKSARLLAFLWDLIQFLFCQPVLFIFMKASR